MNPCAECGFEYDLTLAEQVPALATEYAAEYGDLLKVDDSALRKRPAPEVWSPLEYACHMRDVLLVQRERILAARRTTTPTVEPMGRDERVDHDGYSEQDPADVTRQLRDATLLFTGDLTRLTAEDLERTLIFPFPEPTEHSLRWMAMHTLHELRHHLVDIRRQLEPA
ncbi:DinB family protein [Nocardia pseudobrasiliensis]|uniref:DinB family protein n=1 Tax=Nocardia pseudobrasiliensis TaxID=45979 RepID=A0A370HZF1_9NOCA|nr:DinB family protein [Nocardia pseudobrasiliensis]RDI63859.1 DinB family protein [Nocardia pseudobrasiliensis]